MASARTAMLSLLPRRSPPGGVSSISRCLISKRCHSILAAASSGNCTTSYTNNHNDVSRHHHQQHYDVLNSIHHQNNHHNTNSISKRWLSSKYASVDHSSAYEEAMTTSHGVQLQLALEEGRGKDDAPFDPFSLFLDQMGNSTEGELEGGNDDEIEEAEYETIEEYEEESSDDTQQNDEDDDDEEDDEDEEEGPIYTTTGALHRPKSEKLALRAGYPAGGKFAVILLSGFQHKVTADDLLVVNKLKPVSDWSVGSTHTVKNDDILLMANQDKTLVGLPGVAGGEVDLMVEEITRDKTLVVFKKRRRKHSRRKNGFRRQVTFLRVLDVRMPKGEEVVVGRSDEGAEEEEVRMAA